MRPDRLQLSVLLDASLVVSLRSAARQRGMTIASLVERALEVELDGYVESAAGGGDGAAAQSGGVGGVGGRVGERGPVSPDSGRRVAPDWDALLAAGRATKTPAYSGVVVRDPIEEIA